MLKSLEINGFKSFRNKSELNFNAPISAIVGPNGSGKSNAAEAFRFVLGEQSLKALRARHSDELLYNGGLGGRRRNRASVRAVFDNSSNWLDIDYSEVVIERIIQRGDSGTYKINGSQVRLKDVIDLLSDANIGTSKHHIISQGEADKILNVNKRDRKSIIEDALGLRRFFRRRREAIQKLERTEENLNQVETRQQDLQPELKYLNKQKDRIEKTKELRDKLTKKYQEFFKRESILISHQEKSIEKKREDLEAELKSLEEKITVVEKDVKSAQSNQKEENSVSEEEIKKELHQIEDDLADVTKSIGKVDGQLQALEKQQRGNLNNESCITIQTSLFLKYRNNFEELLEQSKDAEDSSEKISLFDKLKESLQSFLNKVDESNSSYESTDYSDKISNLKKEKSDLKDKQKQLKDKQKQLRQERSERQRNERQQETNLHESEKELLQLKSKHENTTAELSRIKEKAHNLEQLQEQVADEKSEARILCGKTALDTSSASLINSEGEEISSEELIKTNKINVDREFRRQLERLKIKLEDTRVSDQKDVLNEYSRVKSQMEFLEKEIADLRNSKESLLELIDDIETTVAKKFDQGIKDINEVFSDFFATMFGGGDAELFITKHPKGKNVQVDEIEETPEETERGVGINVKLPNKKIRGLGVLSGGERSLVSIALLFALSQINPPPFIVLDEADAALDEANSRRFGDMINQLSSQSQLIIITHNRETMHRADVLYGVTMDQNGGSRLLSLNFSEAVDAVEA